MTIRSAGKEWTTKEAQGATFVELFFDLVFVFAVTSITGLLLHNLNWGGVGHSILILWLVWWAWTQFTWTLNPADTNHPAVRVITLTATAAAFFMAQAIPDAFTSAGAWFAFSYVLVRLLGLGLQLSLNFQIQDNARAVAVWVAGSGIGLVAVVAGGLLPSPWREILWTAAVISDLLSASRAGRGRWSLNARHFAERHGLIVIIALGESLIAAGLALGHVLRDMTFMISTVTTVIAVCALWWIYFGLAKDEFEDHLETRTADETGAEARNIYSWGHLPIIAGIIAFAVAIEQVLTHPNEALAPEALVALAFGVLLYFGGIAYGLHHSGRRSVVPWVIATVIALTGLVASSAASGLVSLLTVTVVLVAFALWGSWRGDRRDQPEPRSADTDTQSRRRPDQLL